MYKAKLFLNGHEFIGTLDMYVIKTVSNELNTPVHNIFSKMSELDVASVSAIVIEALKRVDVNSSLAFLDLYSKLDRDSENLFKVFEFINRLMEKCMPLASKTEESEFEDIPDSTSGDEWDFPYMEYTWKTVLLREEDFWSTTPKNFFEQVGCYKKAKNIKDDNVEHL